MENKNLSAQTFSKVSADKHIPVLLSEVLKYLEPKAGESYLDLTAGYGGHAKAILERTLRTDLATLVDRDTNAVDDLHSQPELEGTQIIHKDFLSASEDLLGQGRKYDLILADLGVSSPHLDEAERGFSIKTDGPLDMRMDQSQQLTANVIVNKYSEADLASVLRDYGEEPKARSIAAKIVANRPITSTHRLAEVVAKAWPGHSKIHPATKSFQALRLAVNDELGQLESALPKWLALLSPTGRLVVISFHSLEDRLVKQFMSDHGGEGYDAQLKVLTKKPLSASAPELVSNPRSRSAKLRAAVKIKKEGEVSANTG